MNDNLPLTLHAAWHRFTQTTRPFWLRGMLTLIALLCGLTAALLATGWDWLAAPFGLVACLIVAWMAVWEP